MNIKLLKILDRVTPGASRSLGWEVVMMALTVPASIFLNRTLGAEDRGLLALVTLLPSTIFTLGTCQWERILRGLITSKQISGQEAWRRSLYYSLWLSVVFIPIGVFISLFYDNIPSHLRLTSILYYGEFPIYLLYCCLISIYVAVGSIDGQYVMKLSAQGSYLFLILGLFVTRLVSVPSIVFVYAMIHFISLAVGWSYRKKILSGDVLEERPPILPLVKAFFPNLIETFAAKIDTWTFSVYGSLLSLGHYTAITALMLPVGLVSNAMNNGSTARLDWTKPSLVNRYLWKTLIILILFLLVLVLGGVILGPYLLKTLLGKSFTGGEWMIPWIAGIVVAQAAGLQFHFALQLSGALNAYLIIQVVEPFLRSIIVFGLGSLLSEFGILLGMIISSVLKILFCVFYQIRIKE